MSEPTSRSGEPDQFAAIAQCVSYMATEVSDGVGVAAALELTKARDRERVYRELVAKLDGIAQTYRCDWGSHELVHISESDWDDVKDALAEVAKMGG